MTLTQLAAKLAALSPKQRKMVEALVERLSCQPALAKQRDLTGHSSFGAWANRMDLALDSDDAARKLRKLAVRRGQA